MSLPRISWTLAFVTVAVMGLAEGSDNFAVSADIPVSFEITPPDPVPWTLRLGSNEFHNNNYYVYIMSNCPDPWSMYVSANREKMASSSHPEDVLANGMNLTFTGLGLVDEITISTDPQKILSWNGIIANSGVLTLKQDIVLGDKPHKDYKMAITLTVDVD